LLLREERVVGHARRELLRWAHLDAALDDGDVLQLELDRRVEQPLEVVAQALLVGVRDAVDRDELVEIAEQLRPHLLAERTEQLVAPEDELRVDELLGAFTLGDRLGEERGDLAINRRRDALELRRRLLDGRLASGRIGDRLRHALLDELRDLVLYEAF